jgi:hypothetical protein
MAWDPVMWESGRVKACDFGLMSLKMGFLLLIPLIYVELESMTILDRQTPSPR